MQERDKKGYQLSILIPVYNEERTIAGNIGIIRDLLVRDDIRPRFILVDDGSRDGTWGVLKQLAADADDVLALRLSRNFGKEAALCAGVSASGDDLLLIMDADLQHPPRYIRSMLDLMAETGVDIVHGVKASRGRESLAYRVVAHSFYRLFNTLTGIHMGDSSDFKLLSPNVTSTLRRFGENNVFFRGIVNQAGFTGVDFPFEVDERADGISRFSLQKLVRLASNAVLAYTATPLYMTLAGGLLFLALAILLGIQTLWNYFSGHAVDGFSTVILLLLFTGSMIMLSLGIIGAYIAKIYDEVKKRPQFIISERAGSTESAREDSHDDHTLDSNP